MIGLMREFETDEKERWEAIAVDAIVAHGKPGAALAFRPAGGGEDTLPTSVTFNSHAAADLALRTISDKELRRRLNLARMAAGGV
jgi:hypothetical protein